ncbi:MAG: N-acetylmuramoyl-L-alanine amidase, partial [Planctomycetes bacterium]|nr:N-acetylmuramoyl-L-alanine amidase [Planctomycetota bacterium]
MGLKLSLLVACICLFGAALHAQPAKPACIWDPSPNYTSGRGGTTIDAIVIHTTEGTYSGAVSWLKNPSASASAHYVIKEDGSEITQLVDDADRSWHATYYNSRAIGIECAGYAGQAGTWTQGILPKLYDLVAYLCYTYNVQVVHPTNTATVSPQTNDFNGTGLVGHYQVQPWNRTDPGSYFDWNALITEVNNRLGNNNANDIVIDNTDAEFSTLNGTWSTGTSAAGHYGADYRYVTTVGGGSTGACEWRPDIQTSGDYEVQVYYPEGSNRAPDAPFTVRHTGGASTVTVDQTANGGAWLSLGTFNFATGTSGSVELQNNAGGSVVIADAVKFVFIQATTTPPPSGSGDSGGGGSDGGCVSR